MSELKRISLKYVRDYIKKDYKQKDYCYICGSTSDLELHHLYGLSQMWNEWCKQNNITDVTTIEYIKELRVKFYSDNMDLLSNDNLYTLCKSHHQRLHTIYGQVYENRMVPKILRWLNIQRDK